MIVAELSSQCTVCAEGDGKSPPMYLLYPEDSSGPAQHPVLAGLRGILPPARGHPQSPGVLPGGSFSEPTSCEKVLCAPRGWEGDGCPACC